MDFRGPYSTQVLRSTWYPRECFLCVEEMGSQIYSVIGWQSQKHMGAASFEPRVSKPHLSRCSACEQMWGSDGILKVKVGWGNSPLPIPGPCGEQAVVFSFQTVGFIHSSPTLSPLSLLPMHPYSLCV